MPHAQADLISKMKHLGYIADADGVCNGIAYMAMQAVLAHEIDVFNARIARIEKIRADRIAGMPSSELLDIRAFFDGVELYYQPFEYPHLFERGKVPFAQETDKVLSMLTPASLASRGGIAIVDAFSGAYDRSELNTYFKSLRASVNDSQAPVALVLHSSNHTISIGFDPKNRKWIYTDANHLPSKLIESDEEITNIVMTSFLFRDTAVITTEMFVARQNENDMRGRIQQWHQNMSAIEKIDERKAAMKDSFDASLLYAAARRGDTELLDKLIANRADVNQASNMTGATPLFLAAMHGHASVVDHLLRAGANPNQPSSNGGTPLYIALEVGADMKLIKLLLEYGADPTRVCQATAKTPITRAATSKNWPALAAMLASMPAESRLRSSDLDLINANRHEIAQAFCRLMEENQDRTRVLDLTRDLLAGNNLLGKILNEPQNFLGFLFTKTTYQEKKVTQSIKLIGDWFDNYESLAKKAVR